MSVELKNWKELCKEKDERIKELEGKFDLIVERLEERRTKLIREEKCLSAEIVRQDIEIVKGVINEQD